MNETWSNFKLKPATSSLYTSDAVVIYVPTGAGARGSAQIRQFYLKPQFSQKVNPVRERVINHVAAGNAIMEEAEWEITFHTGECPWLAPNVDERFLLNATIKFPVVISATFSGTNIATLRFYWDQASVLKQLRVLTDKQWPVRGAEQVDALHNPQLAQLNPFTPDEAGQEQPAAQAASPKPVRAIDAPGRIFGPVRPEDEVNRVVRRPNHQDKARNIFAYEPPAERPLVTHTPNRLGSSFTFGNEAPTTPTPASRKAAPKEVPNIFSANNDTNQLTNKTANLSLSASTPSRGLYRPKTTNIFGSQE